MKRILLMFGAALAIGAAECDRDADFGTTAVAVWSPSRIVIGVDSNVNSRRGNVVTSQTVCKVRVIGAYVFTGAGFYNHPATRYDLWSTLTSIASQATSVADAGVRVEHDVGPLLRRAVEDARRKNLAGFERDFHSELLTVAIAGLANESPVLAVREFLFDQERIAVESVQEPPQNEPAPAPGALGVSVMGEHGAIDQQFPKARLIPALRRDLAGTVRQLVEIQIHATPDKVSGPVTLVEVTAAGTRWLEKGVCP